MISTPEMPVTTRSQKSSASSQYSVVRPKQGDFRLLNSFTQGAYVLYRTRFSNIHSWIMDNLTAAMSVAAGKTQKEVYNLMANYAIGVERKATASTPAPAAPAKRERSAASINRALWSTWTAWYQAFEDEVYDERGPTGRDRRGAVKDSYTYEAVARWREFAAKKHSLTETQVEDWIGRMDAKRLVAALG
jgi:hypothetical protein